jgi:hypothetical protein
MHNDREDRIRRRAHELWEAAGRTGEAQEHWLQAEEESRLSARSEEARDPEPASEAAKMAEQVEVAMAARNARSKQTGRAGTTGRKKASTKKNPSPEG